MQPLASFSGFKNNNTRQHPWLDTGSVLEGTLRSRGPIEVEGEVSGKIIADDVLIIAETAIIHAEITAAEVIVHGVVKGNIYASKAVHIQQTAKVFGTIETPSLSIKEGGLFEGESVMQESLREADPEQDQGIASPVQDLQEKLQTALG